MIFSYEYRILINVTSGGLAVVRTKIMVFRNVTQHM
jgi:hypothetical protein